MTRPRVLTCRDCHRAFRVTEDEAAWFTVRGLTQPRRCFACRRERRQRRARALFLLDRLADAGLTVHLDDRGALAVPDDMPDELGAPLAGDRRLWRELRRVLHYGDWRTP